VSIRLIVLPLIFQRRIVLAALSAGAAKG